MNHNFKIKIPKPCHEDWNLMTPNQKGRFCKTCVKTVIDFTKKNNNQLHDFFSNTTNENICGVFNKKQLDSITIEIPQETFNYKYSFNKLFILALFLTMGVTLFSCKYPDGKTQKIENVIILDSIKKKKDSIIHVGIEETKIPITGKIEVIETVGEIIIEDVEEEEIIEDLIFGKLR